MKHKRAIREYVLLGVLILLFFLITQLPGLEKFSSPDAIRVLILDAGPWGVLLFLSMLLLTIPLPIPSTPVVLAGGYIFGLVGGTALALLAATLGGSLAFLLSRKYGRPLVGHLVDKHHMVQFDHLFKKRGASAAFVSFALPLFPSDAVNLLLGLTKIKWRVFFVVLVVAHIPRYLILNSLGRDLQGGLQVTPLTVLIFVATGLLVLVVLFRIPLRKFLYRELRDLEKEFG